MLTADMPGTGGAIRSILEDFFVDEEPAYLPSGSGEHLMIRVEKRGVTTDHVAQALAALAGVPGRDVGYAGRKDKYGVTRQWFSLPRCTAEQLAHQQGEGWRVLEAARHGNKLRLGHLRGNRFQVVIRGVAPEALSLAQPIVDRLASAGLPNFFGPQRFGREGRNVQSAVAWLRGGPAPRRRPQRQLLVSALQAALFNAWVARRLAEGRPYLLGDIMKRHDSGGLFVAQEAAGLAERVAAGEISPTGPIFGARMWWSEGEALALEEEVLAAAGFNREFLPRFQKDGRGSRRLLRVFPQNVELVAVDDGLRVDFFLEAGSFATTMLAEITKTADLIAPTRFTAFEEAAT